MRKIVMKKFIQNVSIIILFVSSTAIADMIEPKDLGIVEAPVKGSLSLNLPDVPKHVLHTAEVAFKEHDGLAHLTGVVQLDQDEILAIYEVQGKASNGRLLEADIRPDGTLVELEIEIETSDVPNKVSAAISSLFADFQLAEEKPAIEKSIRPSENGLSEIWYEFSGTNFDVEVRSDAKALLVEPK
jgi:hypothetical protein